jgi:uncharacterized protein DUF2017
VDAGRFQRAEKGGVRLRIPLNERELIREVVQRTRALISAGDDDPAVRRLYPPAYADPELDRDYRELTRTQLTSGRERAYDLVVATLDQELLSAEEADAWMRALNDVRLVLGTRLDVTEDFDWDAVDPRDADAPDLALYAYVSWLQEQLVAAS